MNINNFTIKELKILSENDIYFDFKRGRFIEYHILDGMIPVKKKRVDTLLSDECSKMKLK